MGKEILYLKNIYKKLNNIMVLEDVNLVVMQNESIAILGPSGCGKTTLLRLISGILLPDKGKIFINEQLASTENKIVISPDKRKIGMVFQDLALWPHMNVMENIIFGLCAQGIRKEQCLRSGKEMISLMGLDGLDDRKPSKLSGGQQQRVALARALILKPNLLLLDEPFSSLDKGLKEYLYNKIKELQQKFGFAMIIVTHDEKEAETLTTKILYLNNRTLQEI